MSLFFFTLLTLAVFSTASLPLEKLLQNPKLFAAAFANADPDVVKKMIDLVDKLLAEGQNDKASAIKDHGSRKDEQAAALASFTDASKAFEAVAAKLVTATTNRDNLVAQELEHRSLLDAAVTVLNSAKTKVVNTKSHLDSTTSRVNKEEKALSEVIVQLNSVKSNGRRLLNEADPAAVDNVVAEIKKLIDAGKKEVEDATAAWEEATKKQTEAASVEADARTRHEKTVGELATANAVVKSLTTEKAAKLGEKDRANKILTDANASLASALQWMNQEVNRVDSEKVTLDEVKGLLEKNA